MHKNILRHESEKGRFYPLKKQQYRTDEHIVLSEFCMKAHQILAEN